MNNKFLAPPIAFFVLLVVIGFLNHLLSRYAYRGHGSSAEGKKAYSCGEEFSGHLIQPDYSQFYPFAFFFTVLHVVALVIATVPVQTMETFTMAVLYLTGAIVGLFILLRK